MHFLTADFLGFAFGASGALLLALNHPRWSRFGWVLFLISNAAWLVFSFLRNEYYLMLQTLVFVGTSSLGVYQWIWKARRQAVRPPFNNTD